MKINSAYAATWPGTIDNNFPAAAATTTTATKPMKMQPKS